MNEENEREHDLNSAERDAASSAGGGSKVIAGVQASQGGDADEGLLDQAGIDALLGHLAGSGAAAASGASPGVATAGAGAGAGRAAPAVGPEFSLPEVDPASGAESRSSPDQIDLLKDVNVKVRVELGRGSMYLRDILRLAAGSVVELEKLAGDPLDIYVNDRLIAKGEVLVLNENFCIRVTEIFTPREVLRLTS